MKKTVNELVSELKQISDAHLQINDFFWGDFIRAYSNNKLKYPLMCCYYADGSLEDNITPLNLFIIIADKQDKGNNKTSSVELGNLVEVESDTLQVVRDVYNVINNSRRWNRFSKVQSASIQKFQEHGGDTVVAHVVNISLGLKDSRSICNLPMVGYDFEGTPINECEGVDIYIDGVFSQTVVSGGSYDCITS